MEIEVETKKMELLEVKKIPKMKISLNDYIEWEKQYQWPLRQGNWNCPQWRETKDWSKKWVVPWWPLGEQHVV